MFLGGYIEVKAPSKKEWNEFLAKHRVFRQKLEEIEQKGTLEYDEDLEEWRREDD